MVKTARDPGSASRGARVGRDGRAGRRLPAARSSESRLSRRSSASRRRSRTSCGGSGALRTLSRSGPSSWASWRRSRAVMALELLRRAQQEGYAGGTSALYALVRELRPEKPRPIVRFEDLAVEFSQHDGAGVPPPASRRVPRPHRGGVPGSPAARATRRMLGARERDSGGRGHSRLTRLRSRTRCAAARVAASHEAPRRAWRASSRR
jgi:hypothetical protein